MAQCCKRDFCLGGWTALLMVYSTALWQGMPIRVLVMVSWAWRPVVMHLVGLVLVFKVVGPEGTSFHLEVRAVV